MSGSYVLTKSAHSQFKFSLTAANGEVVLSSQPFTTKVSAEQGIEAVRKNSALDRRYDLRTTKSNQAFFVLKARNKAVIGRSEAYSSEAARDNAIESVKANGPTATVKDET